MMKYSKSSFSASRSQRGFTLIEVMVSLVIFVGLSFGVYQVLNQVQRSELMTRESTSRLNQLQKAILIMDADFRQMARRPFRNNGGSASEYWLLWQDYLFDSDSKGILFTRLGWSNPNYQFPRGEVVKVGYKIVNKQLQRVWWRYPDTAAGDNGVVSPLLDGVISMSAKFYYQDQWLDNWEVESALPEGIALKLELEDFGEISRIYLLPEQPEEEDGELE
ncbi:type II secretion system minor pseudopilin GspJ [Vibrio sp. RC27]